MLKKHNEKIKLNDRYEWDLNSSASSHAMVTGQTGSGKSMFLYYLILEAAEFTDEIYVIDGKGGDLTNLTAVKVSQTTEQVVSALEALVSEMHTRISEIKLTNRGDITAAENGRPHIFCFVDELAAIMINSNKADRRNKLANKENSKKSDWIRLKEDNTACIIDAVTELILVARQASIHLVLSAQHFDAKLLGDSTVRSNIGFKVLLGRQTTQEYNMADLTLEQLPDVDFSKTGSGMMMIGGRGWVKARAYETPYIIFQNCSPNDVLLSRIKHYQLSIKV